MSSPNPILEGVLAINKPPAITSAQVIRNVQEHFNPSKLFQPWIENEQSKRDAESRNQKQKRKWRGRRATSVKMGHGGTLDPMATGVLILGVGSGTKQLQYFSTGCTKSYEAVVLFGAATDSYDTDGKVLARKAYEHITKDMVEEALGKFRGKGMQTPPIFSALRIEGKRLYEYAREGKELPREIEERAVEVHELEMSEWMPGGTHEWHWPEKEGDKEEKYFAEKTLKLGSAHASGKTELKRKQEQDATESAEEPKPKRAKDTETSESTTLPDTDNAKKTSDPESNTADDHTDAVQLTQETKAKDTEASITSTKTESLSATTKVPCPAAACRIRMKVTSGFYVRSLCHDLGAAVGSLGLMAALVRTQQGDFELGTNVLTYDELQQGEDVWGPKVKKMLESWVDKSRPSNTSE